VIRQLVTFRDDSLQNVWVFRCVLSDYKESRTDTALFEGVEELRGVCFMRAVIKGDGDFLPLTLHEENEILPLWDPVWG